MPKKPIFQESNEETDEAMTNLLKKLITQTTEQKPKPKQKG